jgi:hypothetical protein
VGAHHDLDRFARHHIGRHGNGGIRSRVRRRGLRAGERRPRLQERAVLNAREANDWPFAGGGSTFTPRRELVTYSVPIPYDAQTLDPSARALRIKNLEHDASRSDLEPSVVKALFEEREALIRNQPKE